jgi:hypothetical protein
MGCFLKQANVLDFKLIKPIRFLKKMKRIQIMHKNNLLPILFLLSMQLYAQKHEVGVQTAYGRSLIDEEFNSDIYNTFTEFDHYLRLGVSYHFTPVKSVFSITSGLNYEAKWLDYNIHFLKIPLGIDFQFGQKYQVIFGGGFNGSVLIGASANEISTTFEEYKNNFLFGYYINIGIGYQLNEKFNFRLTYVIDNDVTDLYTRKIGGKMGGYYTEEYRSYNRFIQLSLKYRMPIKEETK